MNMKTACTVLNGVVQTDGRLFHCPMMVESVVINHVPSSENITRNGRTSGM